MPQNFSPRPPQPGPPPAITVFHDPEASRNQVAQRIFMQLGEALNTAGPIYIGDEIVNVPDAIHFDLRLETPPHGGLALVLRLEWMPEDSNLTYRNGGLNGFKIGNVRQN